MLQDLRTAVRTLASTPLVLIVTTVSLGLGAGVNTTLYSAFRAVFSRPPSAVEPDRLVRLEPGNGNQISIPNLRDLAGGDGFEALTAYAVARLALRSGASLDRVVALAVPANFFDVVGIRPSIGRGLDAGPDTIVITTRFWRRWLPGRADPTGALVTLNGHGFVVAGVLPADHRSLIGALGPDLYVPLTETIVPGVDDRRRDVATLIGRLRPGVSTAQARAALLPRLQALERIHPQAVAGLGSGAFAFPVYGLASWQTRDMPAAAITGLAAAPFALVGLVLSIACANVAAVLLARGAARRREIAVRLALGGSRARIIRLLLAESLVLSAAGAAAGLLLAYWAAALVRTRLPAAFGESLDIAPDLGVFVYTLGLVALVTLACGLFPALASTRPQLTEALRADRAGRPSSGSRGSLVAGQIAVATVMLFLSLIVLRSLDDVRAAHPGFLIDEVVTAGVELDPVRYAGADRVRFALDALAAVRALPGVASASLASMIPLAGDVAARGYAVVGSAARREAYEMHVGPEYFRTLGIRVLDGREFVLADRAGAPDVAAVNQAFVAAHGLDDHAVGARIDGGRGEPTLEIVAVVADTKQALFGERPQPIVYRPFMQAGGRLFIVARGTSGPGALVAPLERTLTRLARDSRVEVATMRDATTLEASARQTGWLVLGGLGLLGLGLASVGLYGLMAYTVVMRTRELGIRMALGASRHHTRGFVLRRALVLLAIGAGIGVVAAFAVTRPLSFLAGSPLADASVAAATAAIVLATGLAASLVPAMRATRVSPLVAIRAE